MTSPRIAQWQRYYEGHGVARGELIYYSSTESHDTAGRPHERFALAGIAPTAGWIDRDNTRRPHGSLGMLTPIEFGTLHFKVLTREPQPAQSRQRTWVGYGRDHGTVNTTNQTINRPPNCGRLHP